MSLAHRPRRPRLRTLLASGALLALSLVLAQCRPVADSLLGTPKGSLFARGNSADCIVACQRTYNDSIRVESNLHVANAMACGDDSVCAALEEARHEAAVERIQAARNACVDACHHQGGGSGGQ
jgi:hypothetical protein